ncbi:hypothetical protein LZC95_10705 [Pendulispora brunnea]|uniref:Uncharacterized protein n=1 Tax=Pendulispora brunnea TaxID=2905690 RepID=A0ABZ2KF35_9BACT
MADPLIILLLVASPEVGDNVTSSMSASAREALGPQAHVLVENRKDLPSDDEALVLATKAHAKAVVELRSSAGTSGTRMLLHAHVPGQGGWIDRTLTFSNVDDPSERGRTAGLAVASMMPLEWRMPAPRVTPPPPPEKEKPPPAKEPWRERAAIDLAGLVALGGARPAWGGQGAVRVDLTRIVGLRALGGVRFGSVPDAGADATTVSLGGGAAFRIAASPRDAARWELALAGDVLALQQSLRREGATESRWLLGVQATAEGAWFFVHHVGLVASVSEELAFGATRVFVGPDRVATLTPFQTLVKVGIRVRF